VASSLRKGRRSAFSVVLDEEVSGAAVVWWTRGFEVVFVLTTNVGGILATKVASLQSFNDAKAERAKSAVEPHEVRVVCRKNRTKRDQIF
jgi:hypothetical protein